MTTKPKQWGLTDDEAEHLRWVIRKGMAGINASKMALRLDSQIAELLAVMREIEKGEGAFSRDPLEHATACIEAMRAKARAVLEGEG